MKGKEKEQLYQKRNYDHYRFSMKELLKYMGQALALCIMADYLFYKSICLLFNGQYLRLTYISPWTYIDTVQCYAKMQMISG